MPLLRLWLIFAAVPAAAEPDSAAEAVLDPDSRRDAAYRGFQKTHFFLHELDAGLKKQVKDLKHMDTEAYEEKLDSSDKPSLDVLNKLTTDAEEKADKADASTEDLSTDDDDKDDDDNDATDDDNDDVSDDDAPRKTKDKLVASSFVQTLNSYSPSKPKHILSQGDPREHQKFTEEEGHNEREFAELSQARDEATNKFANVLGRMRYDAQKYRKHLVASKDEMVEQAKERSDFEEELRKERMAKLMPAAPASFAQVNVDQGLDTAQSLDDWNPSERLNAFENAMDSLDGQFKRAADIYNGEAKQDDLAEAREEGVKTSFLETGSVEDPEDPAMDPATQMREGYMDLHAVSDKFRVLKKKMMEQTEEAKRRTYEASVDLPDAPKSSFIEDGWKYPDGLDDKAKQDLTNLDAILHKGMDKMKRKEERILGVGDDFKRPGFENRKWRELDNALDEREDQRGSGKAFKKKQEDPDTWMNVMKQMGPDDFSAGPEETKQKLQNMGMPENMAKEFTDSAGEAMRKIGGGMHMSKKNIDKEIEKDKKWFGKLPEPFRTNAESEMKRMNKQSKDAMVQAKREQRYKSMYKDALKAGGRSAKYASFLQSASADESPSSKHKTKTHSAGKKPKLSAKHRKLMKMERKKLKLMREKERAATEAAVKAEETLDTVKREADQTGLVVLSEEKEESKYDAKKKEAEAKLKKVEKAAAAEEAEDAKEEAKIYDEERILASTNTTKGLEEALLRDGKMRTKSIAAARGKMAKLEDKLKGFEADILKKPIKWSFERPGGKKSKYREAMQKWIAAGKPKLYTKHAHKANLTGLPSGTSMLELGETANKKLDALQQRVEQRREQRAKKYAKIFEAIRAAPSSFVEVGQPEMTDPVSENLLSSWANNIRQTQSNVQAHEREFYREMGMPDLHSSLLERQTVEEFAREDKELNAAVMPTEQLRTH